MDGGGLTITNAFLGTADYMSPEQAFDPRLADARSDIYSLGCTLHFLLTARPIYGGRSLMQRLLGHRESPIPSLRTARPDVAASLDEAFRRLVAKAPADRPATMDEVVALLESCRRDLGESSKSAPRVLQVFDGKPRPAPRSRRSTRRPDPRPDDLGSSPTPIPRHSSTPRPAPAGVDEEGSGFRGFDPSAGLFTIHGADAIGFRRWIDLVRSEGAIPSGISAFDGGGRPQFAAVAAPGRGGPWEVLIHADSIELAKYAQRKESQGAILTLFAGYEAGPRLGAVTLYRLADDDAGAATGLDHEAVRDRLAELDRINRRVVCLAGYPTDDGCRFAVAWDREDGRRRRCAADFDLPA